MNNNFLICPYCKKPPEKVTGEKIYPHRKDLWGKKYYLCDPCDAYVGCHAASGDPLGRLANKYLRKAKVAAHAAFDPIWKDGSMSRASAYKALAKALDIPPSTCHIGMFDEEMCKRVVIVSKNLKEK